MRLKIVLVLALVSARSQPEIDVSLKDDRVVVRTVRAPLAEILNRFAQATGAQVVYEAARPRQLVTVVIEAASPAQAISQLLEGQGLNYALRLDSTGRKVEMLVVTGSAGPASAAARPGPAAPGSPPALAEWSDEVAGGEDMQADMQSAPELGGVPEAGAPAYEPPGSAPAFAFGGAGSGAAPGADASSPGTAGSPPSPGTAGAPSTEPVEPQAPAAASYPAEPPAPQQPVPPGPASYPSPGD
jgi:hypothetical protein